MCYDYLDVVRICLIVNWLRFRCFVDVKVSVLVVNVEIKSMWFECIFWFWFYFICKFCVFWILFDYWCCWGLVWLFDFLLNGVGFWFVEIFMCDCYFILYCCIIFFNVIEIVGDCIDMDVIWYKVIFCSNMLW